MARNRSEDQAVDAFSAPKDLLRSAHLAAKKLRMSKSGFYRYCLARELGHSEKEALRIAENPRVDEFQVINGGPKKRKVKYS
jgi:hypothetical protein